MKKILLILNALVLSLVGIYALVDARILATMYIYGKGTSISSTLFAGPTRVLLTFPFKDMQMNAHIIWAYIHAPANVKADARGFLHAHLFTLAMDILIIIVIAAAVYFYERKGKKTTLERSLFYLVVPPMLWFLYAFVIL